MRNGTLIEGVLASSAISLPVILASSAISLPVILDNIFEHVELSFLHIFSDKFHDSQT